MERAFLLMALGALLLPGSSSGQAPEDSAPAEPGAAAAEGLYTPAQARRGRETFRQVCAACHSQTEFRGSVFEFTWEGRTVLSLFEQLRATMPWDNPGGLEPEAYADVIAYMLQLNDFPPGDRPLPTDTGALGELRIERSPEGAGTGTPSAPGGGGA